MSLKLLAVEEPETELGFEKTEIGFEEITGEGVLYALKNNPEMTELLAKSVERSHGRQTFETLIGEILERRATLWLGAKSLIVTEILQYPTGVRWVSVRIGTGDMEELKTMLPEIEDYAKRKGCVGVEGAVRKGWARVGRPMGYEPSHIFIEKAL